MKFPITIDQYSAGPDSKNKYRVDFQIWDKDVLTSNDFLSSVTIDFWDLVEESIMTETRAKKTYLQKGKRVTEFVLDTLPNQNLKDEKLKKSSKIRISMDLVPKEEYIIGVILVLIFRAEKVPVGVGRGDPNQDPYLPPPVGRFQFTMNPFKLIVSPKILSNDLGSFGRTSFQEKMLSDHLLHSVHFDLHSCASNADFEHHRASHHQIRACRKP